MSSLTGSTGFTLNPIFSEAKQLNTNVTDSNSLVTYSQVSSMVGGENIWDRTGVTISSHVPGDSLSMGTGSVTANKMVVTDTTPVNDGDLVSKDHHDTQLQTLFADNWKVSGLYITYSAFLPAVTTGVVYIGGAFQNINAFSGGTITVRYYAYGGSEAYTDLANYSTLKDKYNLPTGPGVDFSTMSTNYYTFVDCYISGSEFTLVPSQQQFTTRANAIAGTSSTLVPAGVKVCRFILLKGASAFDYMYEFLNQAPINFTTTNNSCRLRANGRLLINQPLDTYSSDETMKIKTNDISSGIAIQYNTGYNGREFMVSNANSVDAYGCYWSTNVWRSSLASKTVFLQQYHGGNGELEYFSGSSTLGGEISNFERAMAISGTGSNKKVLFGLNSPAIACRVYNYSAFGNGAGTTRTALWVGSDGLLGNDSSIRASKMNIVDSDYEWIYELRPVKYNLRLEENGVYTDNPGPEDYGMIAEEVEEINSKVCFYSDQKDENGNTIKKIQGINYTRLISPAIKCIQEQKKTIDALRTELNDLKTASALMLTRLVTLENTLTQHLLQPQ